MGKFTIVFSHITLDISNLCTGTSKAKESLYLVILDGPSSDFVYFVKPLTLVGATMSV